MNEDTLSQFRAVGEALGLRDESIYGVARGIPPQIALDIQSIFDEITGSLEMESDLEYIEGQTGYHKIKKRRDLSLYHLIQLSIPIMLSWHENGVSELTEGIHTHLRLARRLIRGRDGMVYHLLHELAHAVEHETNGREKGKSHTRSYIWTLEKLLGEHAPEAFAECGAMSYYRQQGKIRQAKASLELDVPVGTVLTWVQDDQRRVAVVSRYFDEIAHLIDLLNPDRDRKPYRASRGWLRGNGYEVISPSEIKSLVPSSGAESLPPED
jgi:hypothetical protein